MSSSTSNEMLAEIKKQIQNHIKTLPTRQCNYSTKENKKVKYLDFTQADSILYQLLAQENPDANVKLWLHREVFKSLKDIRKVPHKNTVSKGHQHSLKRPLVQTQK